MYRSVISAQQVPAKAIDRWEQAAGFTLASSWHAHIAYINDKILNDRTKEKLFKVITRAIPVGRKFANSATISSACIFCNALEDE